MNGSEVVVPRHKSGGIAELCRRDEGLVKSRQDLWLLKSSGLMAFVDWYAGVAWPRHKSGGVFEPHGVSQGLLMDGRPVVEPWQKGGELESCHKGGAIAES